LNINTALPFSVVKAVYSRFPKLKTYAGKTGNFETQGLSRIILNKKRVNIFIKIKHVIKSIHNFNDCIKICYNYLISNLTALSSLPIYVICHFPRIAPFLNFQTSDKNILNQIILPHWRRPQFTLWKYQSEDCIKWTSVSHVVGDPRDWDLGSRKNWDEYRMVVLIKWKLWEVNAVPAHTIESSVQTAVLAVLRWLVAGFSRRSTGFAPAVILPGLVVGRVAMGYIHIRVLLFPPVNYYSTSVPYSFICHPGDWK
jgi:hypothetical protein